MKLASKQKKEKKHSALWRRLLLALLGVILGINAYLANANNLVGNKLPMPFGYGTAVVLSGSMEPTFSKGDLLFIREPGELRVGDIVVCQSGQNLIVHRVTALDGDMVITQGDANNVPDPPVARQDIRGVVRGWIPGAGALVNVLKTPVGTILLLLCAFLLVELPFRRQKDRDEKELEAMKEEIRRLKEENAENDSQRKE